MSRVYFGNLVTKIQHFSPLKTTIAHNSEHPLNPFQTTAESLQQNEHEADDVSEVIDDDQNISNSRQSNTSLQSSDSQQSKRSYQSSSSPQCNISLQSTDSRQSKRSIQSSDSCTILSEQRRSTYEHNISAVNASSTQGNLDKCPF